MNGRPAARYLMTTAEAYPTHRVDVRVLFGRYLPRQGVFTDLVGITSDPVPPEWPAGRLFLRRASGRLATRIADLLQELSLLVRARRGYAGIIVRDKPVLGLIGLAAARLSGIAFVYWMSFPMPELWAEVAARSGVGWPRRWYARLRAVLGHWVLYRLLVPSADHLFVQSAVMHRELRGRGLRHDRVTEVPMGADLEAPLVPVPRPPQFEGRRVAVYLGTLDRSRRPDILVDSALAVAQRLPDYLLVVIGEADEPLDRGWARRYAAQRGADANVRFLGRLPFEQAQAIAAHAQIGLSPFPRTALLESASPTKAVEYMALGLPVVGNDQPDQADVIRASGAGRCVALEPQAFADAIVALLTDPQACARMGAGGRAWIARHRSYAVLCERVSGPLLTLARDSLGRGGRSSIEIRGQ